MSTESEKGRSYYCHRKINDIECDFDFKITDQKGRRIGIICCIKVYRVEQGGRRTGQSAPLFADLEIGAEVFEVEAHVTRNGQPYGASPGAPLFATEAEAREWLEGRIKRCRKSAERKFQLKRAVP